MSTEQRPVDVQTDTPRRVELVLPMRTVLLVAATAGVLAAFWAIGDTFLFVFVGIFLALVFEYPVRFVMAKTGWSRGLAATITVLGTAVGVLVIALLFLVPLVGSVRDFLQELPAIVEQLRASDELSWLGDSGAAGERASGIRADLGIGAGRDLGRARDRRQLLLRLPHLLHGHLRLPVPAQRHREPEAGAGERADAGRGRALARRLGEGDDLDLTLGDRRRRDRSDRRNDPGSHGLAARLELCRRAGRDRGTARHDPEHRRHDRRGHPRAGPVGRGRAHRRDHHARRPARLPAGREQHPHAEDPGCRRQPLGVLHHRRRHALRRAAGRPRRAHRGPARGDDPDLHPGADGRAPSQGRGGTGLRSMLLNPEAPL